MTKEQWATLLAIKLRNPIENQITIGQAYDWFPEELVNYLTAIDKLNDFIWYINHDKKMQTHRMTSEEPHVDFTIYDTTAGNIIVSAFCWVDTEEGFDYWANLWNKFKSKEDGWGANPANLKKQLRKN